MVSALPEVTWSVEAASAGKVPFPGRLHWTGCAFASVGRTAAPSARPEAFGSHTHQGAPAGCGNHTVNGRATSVWQAQAHWVVFPSVCPASLRSGLSCIYGFQGIGN